jgi:hypothetical protein
MTTMNAMPQCQRWRNGRASYRLAREPIDTSRYGVEPIEERLAKPFIVANHYSGTYPAARFRAGLFRTVPFRKSELVGTAVFSVPMAPRAILHYTGQPKGVELGRFCLLDDVEANGETWFLARAMRLLSTALPDLRAVLSYSDPIPRHALDGTVVLPGHVGIVYQALSALYMGKSSARTIFLRPDGRTLLSERALCKLRADDSGADYAYAQLLAAGAPPRQQAEAGAAYVQRALREGPFRRFRHSGCHAYLWALGSHVERKAITAQRPALDYPKAA